MDEELKLTMKLIDKASDPAKEVSKSIKDVMWETKAAREEAKAAAAEQRRLAKEAKQTAAEAKLISRAKEKQEQAEAKIARSLHKESLAAAKERDKVEKKKAADAAAFEKHAASEAAKAAKQRGAADAKAAKDAEYNKLARSIRNLSAIQLAQIAYGWGKALASAAVNAWDFEHVLGRQLELFTKSAPAAKQLFAELDAFSARTGNDTAAVGGWAMQLQEAGLAGEDLKKTLSAMADVKAMGFHGEAFIQAAKGIREMELAGRKVMTGTQLVEMFKSTGLDQERLEKSLGLKGTRYEINEQLALMTVDTKKGLMAMRRAVQDATGKPLGSFAAGSEGDTVASKFGEVSKTIGAMFAKADWEPVKMAIDSIMKSFSKPENVKMFSDAIATLVTTTAVLTYSLEGLTLGTAWLIKMFGDIPENLRFIGREFMFWCDDVGGAVTNWADGVSKTIQGWMDSLGYWFEVSVPETFYDAGRAITDGLWNGIKSGWSGLVKGVKDLANQLPEGVRKVLGIHSPSKVMFEAGEHFTAGMEGGIESGAPAVEQAAARMATGGATAASGAAKPSGSSRGDTSITIHWNAPSPGGPPSQSDEMAWKAMAARVFTEWATA